MMAIQKMMTPAAKVASPPFAVTIFAVRICRLEPKGTKIVTTATRPMAMAAIRVVKLKAVAMALWIRAKIVTTVIRRTVMIAPTAVLWRGVATVYDAATSLKAKTTMKLVMMVTAAIPTLARGPASLLVAAIVYDAPISP
jgi:putative intracellular protease/amidase